MVSSKDMYVVHQEAIQAGWVLPEVQRAIDALVLEKAKELAKTCPVEPYNFFAFPASNGRNAIGR